MKYQRRVHGRQRVLIASFLLLVAAAAVGILMVRLFGIRQERVREMPEAETITMPPQSPAAPPISEERTPTPSAPPEDLTVSSFTDLFSGVGWIDEERSTLYHDRKVTALTFPPVLRLQKIESELELLRARTLQFLERSSDGTDTRCIDGQCLRDKDSLLFFSSDPASGFRPLSLPAEVAGRELESVSIGALDSRWLVGVVAKEVDRYVGRVFYFDGRNFSELRGFPLVSEYPGRFGFGGSDSEWLLIYGAYEGMAWRVREVRGREIYERLPSTFFGIRVMAGGFQPAVLRVVYGDLVRWYVFGLPPAPPRLLKIFQNTRDGPLGALDVGVQALPAEIKNASVVLWESGFAGTTLALKVTKEDGTEELWKSTDLGFDKSKKREVASLNINNYLAEVRSVRISELDLTPGGARIRFFVSNNGREWLAAEPQQDIAFPDRHGHQLLWRAELVPDTDPITSPFFDRIRLDFVVKFL